MLISFPFFLFMSYVRQSVSVHRSVRLSTVLVSSPRETDNLIINKCLRGFIRIISIHILFFFLFNSYFDIITDDVWRVSSVLRDSKPGFVYLSVSPSPVYFLVPKCSLTFSVTAPAHQHATGVAVYPVKLVLWGS